MSTMAEIQSQAIIDWVVKIHANNPLNSVLTTGQLVTMATQYTQQLKRDEANGNTRKTSEAESC